MIILRELEKVVINLGFMYDKKNISVHKAKNKTFNWWKESMKNL